MKTGFQRSQRETQRRRELADKQRRCSVCGCTDNDACHDDFMGPCWWVGAELCSHCHFGIDASARHRDHQAEVCDRILIEFLPAGVKAQIDAALAEGATPEQIRRAVRAARIRPCELIRLATDAYLEAVVATPIEVPVLVTWDRT